MTFVASLRSFGRDDLPVAGGKGAHLGELIRHGFPVPDGFVVTTAAYALVAQDTRDGVERAEVPGEAREAIARAYAELGSGPVAVRSSATAEDLPGAAFAGQQDTYLNVVGQDALLDAVRRCWGSLWTERAIAYRDRLAIDHAGVRIAVVVQRMVEAETAGVMFTADPVTGDRGRLVVDASPGLGEAVVSGLVTPDHYVLSPSGEVVAFTPGRREVIIRSKAGGGVTREPGTTQETGLSEPDTAREAGLREAGTAQEVGTAQADGLSKSGTAREVLPREFGTAQEVGLPDAALRELVRLGTEVADHFGGPQDIEWTYAGGRVSLVQARPMTALPPPPLGRLNRIQRKIGSVLLEYVPVRPYPIDMSTWLPYGPAGLMGAVTRYYGVRGVFDRFLEERDGVVYRLLPPTPRPSPRLLTTPFRLVAKARRYDPARWTGDPRLDRLLVRTRELAALDLAALPWPELVRVPRRVLDSVTPIAGLRIDYLPASGLALVRLLVLVKLLGRGELFSDLIIGGHTRTADAGHALEELAEEARLTGALDAERLPAAFEAKFQAFLAEYGHRETATPLLVTPPTWADAPETVLDLVRLLAAEPPAPARVDDALDRLLTHPLLRRGRARDRAVRWVRAARAGVAFREDSHFVFTMPQPVLRRALVEIGRRLRAAGVLDRPEDVFHLRLEELEGLEGGLDRLRPVDGEAGAYRRRLRAAVIARAARREELAGVRLIDPRAVFPARPTGDALVVGAPASAGIVTGPVRVVRDPSEFGRLRGGDVLVCPYTNPSWTPLFQRAAAVVVDAGGSASHAAIVAREYGIPAVMGTGEATSILVDGQVVTVDGDAGRVTAAAP